MVQARKRVSYILPPPSESTPLLQLPPPGVSRPGAIGPLLIASATKSGHKGVNDRPQHPRHRLGVASLALDASTQLIGHQAPEGILYSGGRDGLIMSWDLGIQMKRKKQKESISINGSKRRARWETLTGWDDTIDEETTDDERLASDGDVLGEVTSIASKRKREALLGADIPYERRWETDISAFEAGTPTHFRQSVQAHGDWVNDILLYNRNQTVISASSDGTIRAWNPHAAVLEDPSTIGSHSDYVRCLAHCREQNWIASGSFDRAIKIWDLASNTKSPLATLNLPDTSAPKSSIYALAVDPFGHIIASGSPERVIRLWDPRTTKRIGKLVGHTDNIRAMLISADSKYLLTGSADASIKLWSLASQKCLHTFAHHTDSVWSLFSDHPSLEVFYSGDRSGLVCRVDVEDCSDISEGECVLLCNDADAGKPTSEGINKIVVMDDNLLWTASGTSTLRRWNIPPRRVSRPGTYLLDSEVDRFSPVGHVHPKKKRSFPINDSTDANVRLTAEPIHPGTLSAAPSLQSLTSDRFREREIESKWNHLPYDSLIRLISANDPFPQFSARTRDPEVATLYSAASVMSVPRLNLARSSTPFVPAHLAHGSRTEDTVIPSNTARAKYEEREFAADAIPVCPGPDLIISGDAGLVRCIMLNDRMHALAVDTLGGVAVWDVIRGLCLGRYSREDITSASFSGSTVSGSEEGERSPRESLDLVRERIEGEAVISPWCMADTKAGVLTIHLMEKCFEAEVYADEVGFATDRHFNEDSKLNLGKWILRNLFMGFISEEIRRRSRRAEGFSPSLSRPPSHEVFNPRATISPTSSEPLSNHSSSTILICSPSMKRAIVPISPTMVRASPLTTPLIPLHPQLGGLNVMPSIPQSPTLGHHPRSRSTATVDGSDAKEDYFSARLRQNAGPGSPEEPSSKTEPATPVTPGGIMGRLRNFGRIKRPVSDTPSTLPSTSTETPVSGEAKHVIEVPKTPIQDLLSGPLNPAISTDAPMLPKPPNATILISEEGSPSYAVVYRGLVSSCHDNLEALEKVIPMWLAEYLLLNQIPPMPPPIKVSFVLVPWNKNPDVEPLPELLNTQQSKLTANRNLRTRKILCHVQDRLERMSNSSRAASIRSSVDGLPGRNPHSPSRPVAEEAFELLCNETVLPLGMTLAAVRQYVWKSSAELVLVYRRKKKTP